MTPGRGGFLALQVGFTLWVFGGLASFLGCSLVTYRCAPVLAWPTGVLVMLGLWALVDLAWWATRASAQKVRGGSCR